MHLPASGHLEPSYEAFSSLIEAVEPRIREGQAVRRSLPGGGRLHVDRPLPFLCCYVRPPSEPDAGTEQLVMGEASYLTSPLAPAARRGVRRLLKVVAELMRGIFGGFLVVEVWAGAPRETGERAVFRLVEGRRGSCPRVIDALESSLGKLTTGGRRASVEVVSKRVGLRHHLGSPLLESRDLTALGATWIGIEVTPVYRNGVDGQLYPTVLRAFRARFGRALRQGLFAFVKHYTTHEARDSLSLGRRAMGKAVSRADEQLARVARSFDFLLAVNPSNADAMWNEFRRANFDKELSFRYRPLPIDPPLMKRVLYQVPIDQIEDPTVASLFLEKQADLDRQLTMLLDRGTPRFLLGSQQQYNPCEATLVRDAEEILERIPSGARGVAGGGTVDAKRFCKRAERELAQYRKRWEGFAGSVRISDQVAAGLTVSGGHLLVARTHQSPAARVDALIQHEIGTHLVTYYNGTAQRFRQLCTGLAGYDELQEGLAVLAEFLVGGMSPARLRVLAARVVAVRALIDGASFVDVFRLLSRYGFSRRVAFGVTLRVFRGGGLTKDMVYLRGLRTVLAYLAGGGELGPLFVGKLAANHIGIIKELSSRGVLQPAPLSPRYLSRPEARKRLARLRRPCRLYELADRIDESD